MEKEKKTIKTTKPAEKKAQTHGYFEAVGRRKSSIARVRLFEKKPKGGLEKGITINEKELTGFFPMKKHQDVVLAPFEAVAMKDFEATVKVLGGGVSSQAEAIRLGISRALTKINHELRLRLKPLGYLKRDPRTVERKKYGSRKARRPQQWRKR